MDARCVPAPALHREANKSWLFRTQLCLFDLDLQGKNICTRYALKRALPVCREANKSWLFRTQLISDIVAQMLDMEGLPIHKASQHSWLGPKCSWLGARHSHKCKQIAMYRA